jgi:hypothetical protein
MPMFTLGQAARLTGLGKTTITRAIKAGRLSASRRDDGSYEIDPAELHRVYSIQLETPETVTQSGHAAHHAPPNATPRDSSIDSEVAARLAALEVEVQGLKALLDEVRASRDEVRQDRDGWKGQAERLALMRPVETPVTPGPVTEERRSWWRRLAG